MFDFSKVALSVPRQDSRIANQSLSQPGQRIANARVMLIEIHFRMDAVGTIQTWLRYGYPVEGPTGQIWASPTTTR